MSSINRPGRRWPVDLETQVFIKRPHAIDQYRSRAKIPEHYSADRAEEDLRSAICQAMRAGNLLYNDKNTAKLGSRTDHEFVIRIDSPSCSVVYALLEEGASGGKYPFMCHTVFDQDMYFRWNREGKLGTLGEATKGVLQALQLVPAAVQDENQQEIPSIKQEDDIKPNNILYMLVYQTPKGPVRREVAESGLHKEILTLLLEGVPLPEIQVFQKVDMALHIELKK